ncbi:MAG: T9SS type A sorting domain-containing protein [Paludibacter sp.]|nr:T9SS type A sorting domain-containing protein [Paludibacter sp.]
MKKNLTHFAVSKKMALTVGTFVVLAVVLFSCIHLRAVYYPETVQVNSTFEVKMVADMNNPLDGQITERFGYGFVGVLLPVGWTIDTTSVAYDYRGKDNEFDNQHVTGELFFNEEMTAYCITLDNEAWGDEYYWQGFRTDNRLHSNNMDSVVIRFNVTTNNQVGDYMMLVGIQESSYDKDGTTKIPGDPGNTLMDNKPDGPFYKTGNPSSDEFSKEYLTIKVEQGTGTGGIKYSEKDKENYTVSSLGNGKLRVNLLNELKVGATCIVYDINGRQTATQELTQMENTLDITLRQGTYFVALQKDGIRSSKKVLVK